jgi:hypothetical protein
MSNSPVDVSAGGPDEVGPLEYLIVEFPSGQIRDDAFHQLLHLVEQDLVRVLDLEFVARDASGAVSRMDADEIVTAVGGELSAFEGVSSGLLDAEDLIRVGDMIEPGSLAGMVIYENIWVATMAGQLSRDRARVISTGQIPVTDLYPVLEEAGV